MQVEGEAEEAEDTLAGVTVGALRNWLRQVLRLLLLCCSRAAPRVEPLASSEKIASCR